MYSVVPSLRTCDKFIVTMETSKALPDLPLGSISLTVINF